VILGAGRSLPVHYIRAGINVNPIRSLATSGWFAVLANSIASFGAGFGRSSSIVLTPDEKAVCVANQDSGSISVWNWATDGKVREITVGTEPRTVAISPDGRHAFVANQRSQTLAVVDLGAGRCVKSISVGGQPVGVVLAPDGHCVYVSLYAGGYLQGQYHPGLVAVIHLQTRKPAAFVPVKARPFALATAPARNRLYATHYLHLNGRGLVTEIDSEKLVVRREIWLEEDGDVAGGSGGVFNAAASIALHPGGRRAVVVGVHANHRRGVALSGRPLSHKTTVQAAARIIDLDAGRELERGRVVSSFSGQAVAVPVAAAFLPDAEHFIDLYFASNDFKVIRYNEQGMVAEQALLELPAGPTGVAVARDGRNAFFNCRWSETAKQSPNKRSGERRDRQPVEPRPHVPRNQRAYNHNQNAEHRAD